VRYLADENFPGFAVHALKLRGVNISWIGSDAPGIPDNEVLKKAEAEKRVLITFDKDFGYLAFKQQLPSSCGIILFRIPLLPPGQLVNFILNVLESRDDWSGHFSVIDMKRIRMKTLNHRYPITPAS